MAEQSEKPQKILVTCPGCFKRFEVSAKFAGREGPCPNCKKPIRIPTLDEQVVLREQESFGGVKDTKGRLVLKPVEREDAKFSPTALAIGLTIALFVFGMAFFLGGMDPTTLTPILALGSVVLALPLAWGGYWFLRDDELEPHEGTDLWIRVGICSLIYAAIWGIYAFLIGFFDLEPDEFPFLLMLVAIGIAVGSVAGMLCFEMQPIPGILHYLLYLTITVLLRLTMGLDAHFPNFWPRPETPTFDFAELAMLLGSHLPILC
ncbi:MAG: hypothetical protein WD045_08075 [Pirellulaceae bacterium]